MTTKQCNDCLKTLPISKFPIRKVGKHRLRYGHVGYCVSCSRAKRRAWYNKNRDRAILYRKASMYGIEIDVIEDLKSFFGNICAICQVEQSKNLVIDHNHKTGHVRGMLCDDCNVAIGLMRDNTNTLTRAITYINSNGLNIEQSRKRV